MAPSSKPRDIIGEILQNSKYLTPRAKEPLISDSISYKYTNGELSLADLFIQTEYSTKVFISSLTLLASSTEKQFMRLFS
ncbi:hypothetical protein G9A89_010234 [Geosiphon pyriformis]|nr:hypothetical protein G9A89_010234 [Geosiphon pyriformis]